MLQQDIFTLLWAKVGANHHPSHWMNVWEDISCIKTLNTLFSTIRCTFLWLCNVVGNEYLI